MRQEVRGSRPASRQGKGKEKNGGETSRCRAADRELEGLPVSLGDTGTSGVVSTSGDSCFSKVMRTWPGPCGARAYLGCKWTRAMGERGPPTLARSSAGGSEEPHERSCGCLHLTLVSLCCVLVAPARARRGGSPRPSRLALEMPEKEATQERRSLSGRAERCAGGQRTRALFLCRNVFGKRFNLVKKSDRVNQSLLPPNLKIEVNSQESSRLSPL